MKLDKHTAKSVRRQEPQSLHGSDLLVIVEQYGARSVPVRALVAVRPERDDVVDAGCRMLSASRARCSWQALAYIHNRSVVSERCATGRRLSNRRQRGLRLSDGGHVSVSMRRRGRAMVVALARQRYDSL